MPTLTAAGVSARWSILRHLFGQHAAEESFTQRQVDAAGRRSAWQTGTVATVFRNDPHPGWQHAPHSKSHGSVTLTDSRLRVGALESNESSGLPAQFVEANGKAAINYFRTQALADFLVGHRLVEAASVRLADLRQQLSEERSALMARADRLVARGDWDALVKALVPTHWGDAEYLRCGLLARAYREQGKSAEADAAWHAAMCAASGQPQTLARLARMAGDWGWQGAHDEALWNILRRFPTETWVLESLRKSYAARLDTAGLHTVYAWLVSLNPEDAAAKNSFTATALLLDYQTDVIRALAWEGYATSPNNPAYATTYAWSLHLQGKTFEGLMVLRDLPAYQLEKPTVALYYGALLAAAGLKDTARVYLGIAARGSLLLEERAILDQANEGLVEGMRAAA